MIVFENTSGQVFNAVIDRASVPGQRAHDPNPIGRLAEEFSYRPSGQGDLSRLPIVIVMSILHGGPNGILSSSD